MLVMWGRVTGPDGRRWSVRRRWQPWRPRARDFRKVDLSWALGGGNGLVGDLIILILVAVALFVLPLVLILVFFVAEWLLVLLLLPIAVLVRLAFGLPWTVMVEGSSGAGNRWHYTIEVRGWRASRELTKKIRQEIAADGKPRTHMI
jgi:hypothetical protein